MDTCTQQVHVGNIAFVSPVCCMYREKQLLKTMAGPNAEARDLEEGSEIMFLAKDDGRKRFKTNVLDLCNNADEEHKCMVIFKVGTTHNREEDIKVHSCFLATKSPVFDKMFFGPLKESAVIKLTDTEPETFRIFIGFLYYGSPDLVTQENVYEMLYLATKYLVPDLRAICDKLLAGGVDINNLASRLNTSVCFGLESLQGKCIEIIIRCQRELFPSNHLNKCDKETLEFLLMSPYLAIEEGKLLEVLLTWADAELARKNLSITISNKEAILKPLLKLLRLNLLSEKNRHFLLKSEFCPDEAKDDIKSYEQLKTFYFVPKYFNSNIRMDPWRALGLKTSFCAESDSVEMSVATESKTVTVFGIFIVVKKPCCPDIPAPAEKVTWWESDWEDYDGKFTYILNLEPGIYWCSVPEGFSVKPRSFIHILTDSDMNMYDLIEKEVSCAFVKISEEEDFILRTTLIKKTSESCMIKSLSNRDFDVKVIGISYATY